jgi:DNA-directed RNA polymerase subunit RPC12/RpoP
MTVQRCSTCGRFREYHDGDRYCLVCGNESLEAACACGREFDYALHEDGDLHCPRCGLRLRGRAVEFES